MNILRTLFFLRPARSPLSAHEQRVHRSQEAYELVNRLISYAEAENYKRARIAADDLAKCVANLRRVLILEEQSTTPGLPLLAGEKGRSLVSLLPPLHCSFCGKSQDEVNRLIAGPSVFVCNECVEVCNEKIRDDELAQRQPAPAAQSAPAEEIEKQ